MGRDVKIKDRKNKRIYHMNLKRTVAVLLAAMMMINSTTPVYAWRGYAEHDRIKNSTNDSEQLYRWVALDNDRLKFEDFMPKVEDDVYRMLLCYYCTEEGKEGWYYYQADPSCFKRVGDDNYGFSCVKASDTPQVKVGAKEFVTRGGLQAFYVKRTGICTWGTEKTYLNDYQYQLNPCEPGTDKRMDDTKVWWTDGYSFDDVWYYDESGYGVGNQACNDIWESKSWSKFDYHGDIHVDWTLSMTPHVVNELNMFCFTPELNKSHDGHFVHVIKGGKQAFSASDDHFWDTACCEFAIYIGAPIGVETTKKENGKEIKNTSLSKNSQSEVIYQTMDAITSPYLVKKGQKYIVKDDAVLFINDVVVVRGEIINNGLIILGKDGCIIELDDEDSTQRFKLEGGDLIVKKGGYIKLDEIIMEPNRETGRCPQLVNAGSILATRKLSITNTIIDNTGEIYGGYEVQGADLVAVNASKNRGESAWRPHPASGFSLTKDSKTKVNDYILTVGEGNKIIQGSGSKINVGRALN